MHKLTQSFLLAAILAGATASAQNTLTDIFTGGGFDFSGLGTNTQVGTMTLSFGGAAMTPGTTNLLTSLPDFQITATLTSSGGPTYTFNNASLTNGSTISDIEVIAIENGGFLFYNTVANPTNLNKFNGSADFENSDGSFLTTAPPSFLSGNPSALAGDFSLFYSGNTNLNVLSYQGDYGLVPGFAAPEPGPLILGALGCASLLLFRRRK